MNTTPTKPTLEEVIEFLSAPAPQGLDVSDLLVRTWAESTPDDADDSYARQARILAAILDRHVNAFVVTEAMIACANISRLEGGHDVGVVYLGSPNTDEARDSWLDYERQNLTLSAHTLGGGR